MVLPLIKVVSLVIKSASKPMAKQIRLQAARSPKFHRVVVSCANAWHSAEGKLSIWVGDKFKEPKPLNVNAAIDLGSELASEGFLLTIAIVLLMLENRRSSNKDKQKEEKIKERFSELENEMAKQQEDIQALKNIIISQREKELAQANGPIPLKIITETNHQPSQTTTPKENASTPPNLT